MRKTVLIISAMLLAGCATLGDLAPPEVSLVDLGFGEVKLLETTGTATVRVDNENDQPLQIEGLVCKLYVNGKRIGKGMSGQHFEIPPFGSTSQQVDMHLDNLSLAKRVRAMIDQQRFAYRLDCRLYVYVDGSRVRVNVSREGELNKQDIAPAAP